MRPRREEIDLASVILDDSIYPRKGGRPRSVVVSRYVENLRAGAQFPPIIVERGTRRVLDGWARVIAYRKVGRETITADFQDVPEGVSAKLYAASLNSGHGIFRPLRELREVAAAVCSAHPEYDRRRVARQLGVLPETLDRWLR